ncbi:MULTISPECIES: MarC family protein [unclassified Actinobaculum]|uniref:MarC family protein n=1 Tax=unclassified Actinobaculum TaxID=2609299 RepID=UPI000D52A646|nr:MULTISPECIES: MarC family protein [unclassified Actinobaculum]AWE42147.1 antibiotic resistance protein MarC [Actinobaculum sp. 313]RTE50710.1 MarC family protein [Actinobaculum sp. 352]
MTGFDVTLFVSTFTTLFVIADPFGNLPVFIALTSRMTPRERRTAAWQATMTSFVVLSVFGLFGNYILDVLHLSVEAVQLSGGLLLLLVALQLLTGHEDDPGEPGSVNVALVPLGVPLLAGPGSIVAVMMAAQQSGKTSGGIWAVVVAMVLVHLVEWVTMYFGNPLHRLLGEGGTMFLVRISGMLLAAIATQLMIDAVLTIVAAA